MPDPTDTAPNAGQDRVTDSAAQQEPIKVKMPPGPTADPRYSTLATDTLRRILWAAKGAPCTCIQSAGGMGTGGNAEAVLWVGPKHICPRCTAIRDVCEAVPDVI